MAELSHLLAHLASNPMMLLAFMGAYLLGSIPFGLILTRMAGLGDIRAIGSGNIGATNVLRTGKKWLALLTLLCDFGKGFIALRLCGSFMQQQSAYLEPAAHAGELGMRAITDAHLLSLLAIITLLGHIYPVWLQFKGGKGIATLFGIAFALYLTLGLSCAFIWLVLFGVLRISSVAGIAMAATFGIVLYWMQPMLWVAALIMSVLVIARHRENIERLIRGEELRFGASPKPEPVNPTHKQADVIAAAIAALADNDLFRDHGFDANCVADASGELVWHVTSRSMGSQRLVRVRDHDLSILEITSIGVR